MIKGNKAFKCSDIGKRDFEDIKGVVAKACVLFHPDITKNFIIYHYKSKHTIPFILMEENEEGIQAPYDFMCMPYKNQELRYSQMEKHVYAVVRALKNFRFYILHSHLVIHVLDPALKIILKQQDVG